jgi:hypothetical protein
MPSTLQSPGDETGGAETAAPAPERVVSQTRHPLESSHDTSEFKDPASAGTALDPPEADPVARDDRDDRPDSPGNIPQAAAATLTVAAAATTIAPSPRITAVVAEPQERIAESEELVAEPEAAVPPPLPRPPTPRPRRQVLMRRWPIIVAGSVVAALTILVFVLLIWAQHTSAPSDAPPRSPATQR